MRLKDKLSLCYRIIRYRGSNSTRHAENELRGMFNSPERMNQHMARNLMELIVVFATQHHSGFSAGYARNAFKQLSGFKPLGPLTGNDDEWTEIGDGRYQNRRNPSVFKDSDGAYTIDGYIFRDPSGVCYTGRGSRRYIDFPHDHMEPVYVNVDDVGKPLDPKYAHLRN